MSSDADKKNLSVKDMKNAIAQFEQSKKANAGLHPTGPGAQKPSPPTGVKPSLTTTKGPLQKPSIEKDDRVPSPVSTTVGKRQSMSSQSDEAATPFKVALKPVSKPSVSKPPVETEKPVVKSGAVSKPESSGSASSVSNKLKMFEKAEIKAEPGGAKEGDDHPAAATSGGSLVTSRSKKFESLQKQSEADSSNTSSTTGSSMKAHDNSSFSKAAAAPPKPVSKSPFVTGMAQNNSNNASGTPADKGKKEQINSDKAETVQKPRNDEAQETAKPKVKAFSHELENKVSSQRPANTREFSSTSGTLTKKIKDTLESSQTANKVEVKEENKKDDDEQPKVPLRKTEKSEKPKPQSKVPSVVTTEETDQPKIPPRKEQKTQEVKTAEKTVPFKKSTASNQQISETKPSNKLDQNANKIGSDKLQSLQRTKAQMLPPLTKPKENQKKYRLLPVPKPSGNPPRKLAKPPAIDLSKYVIYAKSKGLVVQPPPKLSSVASFDDGDDLYEDCDSVPVRKQSSRISEYTEEEEAKTEKMARAKLGNTTTDNYGKMYNSNNPENYEDDDDIYQEID